MLRTSPKEQSRRSRHTPLPALTPIVIALSFVLPTLAQAAGPLPSGGYFVTGTGSINGNSSSLTIKQTSSKGIIDWTSFSIGSGNHVNIMNGTGATLNRVTGTDLSSILGTLSATGSVYLINPQGIIVGSSGVVSTGGRFLASTLDVDNTAFMKGGALTFAGSTGSVTNLGKISSSGGDVFLIASNNVVNIGTISAPNGTAEFAVGNPVLLRDSSTGQQVFVREADSTLGTVLNRGVIEAAQINVQAADGNIYAFAGNHAVLRATGTKTRAGHVWLVADFGQITIDGTIEARNADGSGGTVDMSAGNWQIADDVNGKPWVKAQQWNIISPDFTVTSLAAPAFERSLNNGTSIRIQATGAYYGTNGDIDVASSIQWFGAASLTLSAYHSLTIEAAAKLKNTGTGKLTLRADSTAIDDGGGITNKGTVDWSTSKGIVSAFYDMKGRYAPGKMLTNASWTSPSYSGVVTQITGYKLVNSLADLEKVAADLGGNYALGRNIDASATSNGSYIPIGSDNTPFTGQFDGEGHTIESLLLQGKTSYTFDNTPVVLGLFGTLGASSVVRNLNVNGNVSILDSGEWKSGTVGTEGILAANNYGTILRVHTTGNIVNSGWFDLTTAGGLVGFNRGRIERSSSSVNLNGGGTFGGLVGENDGAIAQSYATGFVETTDMPAGSSQSIGVPGGLVGINNGTIDQSYATGAVTANCESFCAAAGGLVNVNRGTINQSFATGAVVGATGSGGIAAENDGLIGSDVYWNKDTTGMTTGVGIGSPLPASNGLTTAQMSNPASFLGWNFQSTGAWALPAGDSHPILRWQLQPPVSD